MRRFGQVIGLKPDQIEAYKCLHAARLAWTEPMQVPLETRAPGEWWTTMKEVFHTD